MQLKRMRRLTDSHVDSFYHTLKPLLDDTAGTNGLGGLLNTAINGSRASPGLIDFMANEHKSRESPKETPQSSQTNKSTDG